VKLEAMKLMKTLALSSALVLYPLAAHAADYKEK